ncbi:hypothetical protein FKM82_021775 [Ascaphus truei]
MGGGTRCIGLGGGSRCIGLGGGLSVVCGGRNKMHWARGEKRCSVCVWDQVQCVGRNKVQCVREERDVVCAGGTRCSILGRN